MPANEIQGRVNRPNRPLSVLMDEVVIPSAIVPWPIDWAQAFGSAGGAVLDDGSPPGLVVEIGFGNGEFLIEQALRHPDRRFVGVEVSWTSIQHLLKRIDQCGVSTIRVIQSNAVAALDCLFSSESIFEVFVNFPDPWRKDRHHHRRFVRRETIELLADRLVMSGRLTIATDHAPYAQWIADVLEDQDHLTSVFDSTSVARLEGRKTSKYERKARDAGVPIHYFVWRKCKRPSVSPLALEVFDMPNVILRPEPALFASSKVSCFDCFAPRDWREEHRGLPVLIKLMSSFVETTQGDPLLEVLVKEGNLSQRFAVHVLKRPNGEILIKLSGLGQPRPTWGVKRVVWHVAQRLLDMNPHLRVVSTTVGSLTQPEEAAAPPS